MVATVEEGLGPIDVLVNNAGVFPRVPFLELSESDWDYVLDVNLKGTCFCAQAVAALGHLDLLVNNAGVLKRTPFLDIAEREWDWILGTNLKGSFFCAQAVAQAMVRAGRAGSIINLTSGAAFRGSPRGVHYCASKGGVVSMTRQMALELAPHRIRVNAIAPGLTDTAQPRYGMDEEELASAGRAIPLGHIAQPEEIARAAVFLASDNAGFITGQCLHVNGGGYFG